MTLGAHTLPTSTPAPISAQAPTPPPPSPPQPPREWTNQGSTAEPPAPGLEDLGISGSAVHTFVSPLQVVVMAGMGLALPSLSPIAPLGRVAALSLIHIRFACGVAADEDLPPIW